jgi:hypothetical protein
VLLKFLKTHSLRPFGIYLGLLGLLLVLATAIPGFLPFLPRNDGAAVAAQGERASGWIVGAR